MKKAPAPAKRAAAKKAPAKKATGSKGLVANVAARQAEEIARQIVRKKPGKRFRPPSPSRGAVMMRSGEVLTEADFQRMAEEAESAVPDIAAIMARAKIGRPPLGNGPSTTLQVRLDPATRRELERQAAANDETPSAFVRQAIAEKLQSRVRG